MTQEEITTEETTYCAVHPDRETGLRCNLCERYMCAECAVSTPVGYRCKQCVRQVEDRFFSGTQVDYIVAFVTAAIISGLGLIPASLVGFFWIILIIVGIFVGGVITQTVQRVTKRRRGRYTAHVTTAGVLVGAMALSLVLAGGISLPVLLYAGPAAVIVYQRFKG
jgi:hypothetical protein